MAMTQDNRGTMTAMAVKPLEAPDLGFVPIPCCLNLCRDIFAKFGKSMVPKYGYANMNGHAHHFAVICMKFEHHSVRPAPVIVRRMR